jgi:ribonucleoside-diphosphate reductase alpha subunit
MLQTVGVFSTISYDDGYYIINIDAYNIIQLQSLGFTPKIIYIPKIDSTQNIIHMSVHVASIEDNGEFDDTYCFNEPLEHKGMFNGILTGQCSEIIEYSSPTEIAVCNLASICLPTFITNDSYDFEKLHQVVKIITKNLNKVIDINFYPLEKARRSNLMHRPIGIGVQGLADTFAILKYDFEGADAKILNTMIFETIYHAALEASMEIAKNNLGPKNEFDPPIDSKYPGAYSSFVGSPAELGKLQFDLWNKQPSNMYDWNQLKSQIKKYGIRNSLLVAPMPTASTSQIMGFNEAFEPFTSNIYKRKTMAGEFIMLNKYLVSELINIGLWNKEIREKIIMNEGSVQNIDEIPDRIKNVYKIVWEMKQKTLIDMAADRGIYVCQSQSMNLFMEDPDFKKLSSMHFYTWQKGLKTGIYYLRTRTKAKPQKFTLAPQEGKINKKNVVCNDDICISCGS